MSELVQRLWREIERIGLVDPHSHIDPLAPAARSLNELLGYHYYTELAHSAGLAREEIESAKGPELARKLIAAARRFDNTVQYSWLSEIAAEFFGFERALDPDNIGDLYAKVEIATAAPDWADQVFRRSGLEAIFLTNDFDDPLAGFDTEKYVPCLRVDDLLFRLGDATIRDRLAAATGDAAVTLNGFRDRLEVLFGRFIKKGARACAVSLPPDFEPIRTSDAKLSQLLDQTFQGDPGEKIRGELASALIFEMADACERHQLPFDLMIGVRRNVYPAGVHQGRDLFDQRTSLASFAPLFNQKPGVTFPVSVLTHGQNQELASFAWIFPNVVTSGHWWYSNVPAFIEPDLRARLEAVPWSKQIGYYSDAYKLEFVLPKFRMYRRCLARVLAEEFVLGRRWPEERAIDLAGAILRDNVTTIFPAR